MDRWLPIETARLLLRETRPEDEDDVHEYASDPCVSRYESWGPNTREKTHEVVARRLKAQQEWPRDEIDLAVELKSEHRVIGTMKLHIKDHEKSSAYIGYVFNRRYWNHGYATEAARALLNSAFRDFNLHRIWATCDTRNVASSRVMEKLGMRREAHFVKDAFQKGEWCDSYLYAILADEWFTVTGGITTRDAQSRDLDQLLALFDAVAAEGKWIATEPGFDKDLYQKTWQGIIDGRGGALFVACAGDKIVGSLSIFVTQSGEHDLGMLVSQERRGQGVGTALMRKALHWAQQNKVPALGLGVFTHNEAAIRLYEKMGFVHVGRREQPMTRQTGEMWDVILMRKQLSSAGKR